jgi:hypothetical protein
VVRRPRGEAVEVELLLWEEVVQRRVEEGAARPVSLTVCERMEEGWVVSCRWAASVSWGCRALNAWTLRKPAVGCFAGWPPRGSRAPRRVGEEERRAVVGSLEEVEAHRAELKILMRFRGLRGMATPCLRPCSRRLHRSCAAWECPQPICRPAEELHSPFLRLRCRLCRYYFECGCRQEQVVRGRRAVWPCPGLEGRREPLGRLSWWICPPEELIDHW